MKNLKGKRVVLYRRVSTTDQKEYGNSLNTQRDSLRAFAQRHEMEVVREYQEDFSAKNFNRPAFSDLMNYVIANRKKIDYVLITNWDRFSRKLQGALNVIETLKELGVIVNSISQWIN